MILIDAHCHLEKKDFPLPQEAIARARAAGLAHAIVVGQLQHPGDFGSAIEVAAQHRDFLTPTMGIHPHDAAKATADDWKTFEGLCARPEVCAVGETGLDFYYNHSPRAEQADAFHRQCQLAKSLNKPVVIHVRDAHDECFEILKSEGMSRGQIHCFTGGPKDAERYLSLGFHISVSGVVTYKKTEALQEAVANTPLDRLLVETDSPYLAPIPYRGKKNEPGWVAMTCKRVAELQRRDPDEVALACAKNAVALFGLKVAL